MKQPVIFAIFGRKSGGYGPWTPTTAIAFNEEEMIEELASFQKNFPDDEFIVSQSLVLMLPKGIDLSGAMPGGHSTEDSQS